MKLEVINKKPIQIEVSRELVPALVKGLLDYKFTEQANKLISDVLITGSSSPARASP